MIKGYRQLQSTVVNHHTESLYPVSLTLFTGRDDATVGFFFSLTDEKTDSERLTSLL